MSHTGNGENDFDGLDKLKNLPLDVLESVRQARIEARNIIDKLEPFHISGWPTLIRILEDALEMAKMNAEIFRPDRHR